MVPRDEDEFREGLRQYIILSGKAYGKLLSKAEDDRMFDLFLNFGLPEEVRVQMGAKPTFTNEEYDALFEEGRRLQNLVTADKEGEDER